MTQAFGKAPFSRRLPVLALLLALAGCASERAAPPSAMTPPAATTSAHFTPPAPPPASARMQCVPYARAATGIEIRGDAWSWWQQAEGRYAKGQRPTPYAVLVLAQGVRLDQGHLAVVRDVIDRRRIRVDHANWANDGRILTGMTVVDVSAGNDWTEVRFWNPGADEWGNVYIANGFIYPSGVTPEGATAQLAP